MYLVVNLGKWALGNLFSGLIKAEALDIQLYAAANGEESETLSTPITTQTSSASVGINRSPAPKFISLDKPTASPGRRLRSYSSLSSNAPPTPGGLMVGFATPAATPAILPAATASQNYNDRGTAGNQSLINTRASALAAIPQSPAAASSMANTPATEVLTPVIGGLATSRPEAGAGGKDYFSFRGSRSKATPGVGNGKDPSPTRKSDIPQTPGGAFSPSPQTPGGGLMNKFKFGNKGKKTQGEVPVTGTPGAPAHPEPVPEEDKASTYGKCFWVTHTNRVHVTTLQGPNVSPEEAEQLKVLAAVRSHVFAPPPFTEAPPIDLPLNTALLISEESKDAGAWGVKYRSMVSRTEQDIVPLEMASPGWMLEYLFAGRIRRAREPVKLCFVLEPWQDGDESNRMKAMPVK